MSDLQLALNGEYFDAIAAGTKWEEYRKTSAYWRRRIEGRTYRNVILTRGYPPAGDPDRTLIRPWRGYRVITITHPHFDNVPTEVFAIAVHP